MGTLVDGLSADKGARCKLGVEYSDHRPFIKSLDSLPHVNCPVQIDRDSVQSHVWPPRTYKPKS
jgi:hypothetical protein